MIPSPPSRFERQTRKDDPFLMFDGYPMLDVFDIFERLYDPSIKIRKTSNYRGDSDDDEIVDDENEEYEETEDEHETTEYEGTEDEESEEEYESTEDEYENTEDEETEDSISEYENTEDEH
jgi:hypothetical protein